MSIAQTRTVIYPDIIPGAKLQILNLPGFRSFDDCKPKCKMETSIPYDQEIVATGQKKIQSFEDQDGDTVVEEYIEVETASGVKGWVPADLTSHDRPSEDPSVGDKSNTWFSMRTAKRDSTSQGSLEKVCSAAWNFIFPPAKFEPSASDMHSVTKKAEEEALRAKLPLYQTTKIVEQLVGKCAVDDPANISEADLKGKLSYDKLVIPKLINDEVTVYKKEKKVTVAIKQSALLHVRDLDIPHLNPQKLIEIDALSRTIFAEMAGCIPIGPQYAMAVARVIKNREKAIEDSLIKKEEDRKKNPDKIDPKKKTKEQSEFLWEKIATPKTGESDEDTEKRSIKHWPGKNLSSKIATSPVQFSGWNNHIIDSQALKKAREARRKELIRQGKSSAEAAKLAREQIKEDPDTLAYYKFNKSGIQHTLCPPSRADENYYKGEKPYPELLAIWHNTVKIAVEATLYPEQFAKKTESLKDVLHYTSGRSSFYGFCPFKNPVVDGKKLDSGRCLNLWIDPDRSPEHCSAEQLAAWNAKKGKKTSATADKKAETKRKPAAKPKAKEKRKK